jgi:hypothetical protein
MADAGTPRGGETSVTMPALAMTTSRAVMPWEDWSSAAAAGQSVSAVELSIFRRTREVVGARGRERRACEAGEEGSRTQAMRVWCGRSRRRVRMPWPMPGCGLHGGLGEEGEGMEGGLTAIYARDEDVCLS